MSSRELAPVATVETVVAVPASTPKGPDTAYVFTGSCERGDHDRCRGIVRTFRNRTP
jgi:hypothetical protein